MRRSIASALAAELGLLVLLLAAVGCREREPTGASQRGAARGPGASSATVVNLAPRPAGKFSCSPESCEQLHPRLPDTGEWLCAERDGVVWCAGGDAAAGVVSGPPDPGYRCGQRWAAGAGAHAKGSERVCIDRHPDYPTESANVQYRCRFLQERGMARRCEPAARAPSQALPERALPACFLDQDCPAGRCDRGACACAAQRDCQHGQCSNGTCVEAQP